MIRGASGPAIAISAALCLTGCGLNRIADDPKINAVALANDRAIAAQQETWRKEEAAAEKAACERKGGPAIGMSRAQLYATCWGKPAKINTTMTSGVEFEQFVYGLGFYVYLRNGVVTSIQTTARAR